VNFLGGHGIVGTHLPVAAGVGYAIKYRGGDQVVLCFFGDSVVNGGPFHEAFNMTAKWELPVVYVVENNSYGMGTDIDRVAAVDELFTRACAYQGKKAEQVDGQDVLAVHDAVSRAVARARKTSRPTFIEARTYRFLGHSMSDPAHGTYRSREEVQAERANDPINNLVDRMEEAGLLTEEEYEALDHSRSRARFRGGRTSTHTCTPTSSGAAWTGGTRGADHLPGGPEPGASRGDEAR
jgi:pyruvate dehydrogenase E1 component alpha subunit